MLSHKVVHKVITVLLSSKENYRHNRRFAYPSNKPGSAHFVYLIFKSNFRIYVLLVWLNLFEHVPTYLKNCIFAVWAYIFVNSIIVNGTLFDNVLLYLRVKRHCHQCVVWFHFISVYVIQSLCWCYYEIMTFFIHR